MVFNNGFPVTYQPIQQPIYQPVYQPQQPQQTQNEYMLWIQGGEEAAKAYQIPAGKTIPLWDSENKVIYLKSTDSSGRPTMEILDYTIRGEKQSSNPTSTEMDQVTRRDLEELRDYFNRQINSIRSNINNPNNSSYRGKENNS